MSSHEKVNSVCRVKYCDETKTIAIYVERKNFLLLAKNGGNLEFPIGEILDHVGKEEVTNLCIIPAGDDDIKKQFLKDVINEFVDTELDGDHQKFMDSVEKWTPRSKP